jgi:hypothetical protein
MKKTLVYASLLASLALVGCKQEPSAPGSDPAPGSSSAPKESVGGDPTQP